MDITDIRLANIELLASEYRLDQEFAKAAGFAPSYLSQLRSRGKNVGNGLAREIELRLGKPPGWMDVPHLSVQSPPGSPAADTIATAATLESLEPGVRDSIKRMILSIALAQIGMVNKLTFTYRDENSNPTEIPDTDRPPGAASSGR